LAPPGPFAAPAVRLLFWALQIGVGLLVLPSTLHLLTRAVAASRVPTWALVVVSGLLGAILLAPLYWAMGEGLLVRWLGYPALPVDDGASLNGDGWVGGLLAEYADIVGPVHHRAGVP
jgi:hypothetical protein